MSFNAKRSYVSYAVATATTDFPITFEEFNDGDKDRVNVLLNGELATSQGYQVTRVSDTVFQLDPAVTAGVVRLERETNIDQTFFRFKAGALFNAANMDSNFSQILHSQQELADRQTYVEDQTLPLVDGLQDALQAADDAANAAAAAAAAAQDAADDANEAATGIRSASSVIDASSLNQQLLNDGIESIADMRLLAPTTKGTRVYLKSWHKDLGLGGGIFVATQSTTLVDDGGMIIATQTPNMFYVRVRDRLITPMMFGAKGDATYDDLPAFQAAINYLWNHKGGTLFVPQPSNEYRWKSYDATNNCCLYVPAPISSPYLDPICVVGESNLTRIKVDLSVSNPTGVQAAVKWGGFTLYKVWENLSIWGGITSLVPYVDYVLHAATAYHANLTLSRMQLYVAKTACFRVATYVTTFTQVQTSYAPRGFHVDKPDGSGSAPCTSITFQNCYALNHTDYGFWCGEMTYCTFVSCAADHIINPTGAVEAYPYYIDIARGVTMIGCGAESSTRILRVRAAQGLTVLGVSTLSIGKVESGQPVSNRLVYIEGGHSVLLGGFHNQNPFKFTYFLTVGAVFGTEAITVLDETIKSSQCSFVGNYGHDRPIRFVCEDYTVKMHDLPVTNTGNAATNAANLSAWMQLNYGREYLHDLIIRLPSGDFPISSQVYCVDKFNRGYGRIRFIGHADGTSRIVCQGLGGINVGLSGKLAPTYATIENATLHIDTPTGTSKGLTLANGDLTLVNSKITSDNTYRQYASDAASKIHVDATSYIATSQFGSGTVDFSYKGTTAPTTSTRLPIGTVFMASDPNATRIGYMNTVADGATWLALH